MFLRLESGPLMYLGNSKLVYHKYTDCNVMLSFDNTKHYELDRRKVLVNDGRTEIYFSFIW